MTLPAPLLELRGVSHRFGATVALDDAALQVRPGTIHALLGENGAGKTTLMRIAFGLVGADAGTVLVSGTPVGIRSPSDAIGHGIGMVHQHFNLIPAMTVAENVALGGHGLLDLPRVRRELGELATASGLPLDPDALVDTLSVAQQQRLEIVKALSRAARVLILDEPTAVLAPAESDELLRWLRAYVSRGNAAVLITHKLREAIAAADDITVLRRGRVVLHAAAMPTAEALTAAMLGEADRLIDAPEVGASRVTHGATDSAQAPAAAIHPAPAGVASLQSV
ncbi:MAG: ATP-binding cassette domain-containing protein, partial [Gemmatimonadaceae bacterium]|nr:ATP-binding cassette domain-containing protein [Gemmatimonadaceae bacterium]